MKRHVRKSKFDPFVDQIGSLDPNLDYVFLKYPNDCDNNIYFHDLVPCTQEENQHNSETNEPLTDVGSYSTKTSLR